MKSSVTRRELTAEEFAAREEEKHRIRQNAAPWAGNFESVVKVQKLIDAAHQRHEPSRRAEGITR